jgi:pyruvate dehydrogenase E2 component (dihydrolipoamide acetyltransferase)
MAGRIEIKVPDIGEFTDIPVIEVLVQAGDRVTAEQSLITLESDKATMEVPSPAAGVIAEVKVALDDTVSEGDVVALLDAEDDAEDSSAEPEPEAPADKSQAEPEPTGGAEPAPAEPPAATPQSVASAASAGPRQSPPVSLDAILPGTVPYASPAIRAFARELGIDLLRVNGSGRKGRILRNDVTAFVKSVMSGTAPVAAPGLEVAPPPKIDFAKFGEIESLELSRIKKITAKNLHRNWVTIPHVTHNDKADITGLEAFRQAHKGEAKAQGFNLTPLVFIMRAAVAALQEFPQFNASLDAGGENLVYKKYYNLGIAVDTPDGLVVPAIRDCDSKGAMQLAGELAEVSQRARDGKLKPADWQGASFSISSLGGIGGNSFNPIINLPEVAILGVSRSVLEPIWDGEAFQPRLMLPLSLSYDHRVIDGAEAARFTRFMAAWLEDSANHTL